ncbi:hypothetical protein CBR_g28790 [Chara braunii]|uniref:Uncharacterized protein n=1 Tax=Chara braunii TaxID=69332 RepID=A0A388L9T6_CHABU|nr:hypothetical protein CBR_g28790 [Chara braunii]|eukprot:GBG79075.1 hypothetical protein CBR_g28790 [Chara braunii]
MEDNPVIGIDLGTSNCCVAVFRNVDDIEIVPNDLGHRITPSFVAFAGQENCVVGDVATKHRVKHPEQCIFEVKRLMGRSLGDATIQQDAKRWPFHLSAGPRGEVVVDVPNMASGCKTHFLPEDISALLLKKLKSIAEDFTGHPIRDAVISIPAYFDHSQRKATMAAGVSAGLNVLRLMSEPTAAALAYGHQRVIGRGAMGRRLLIFDLGGGTFDVSIVTVKDGPDEDSCFVVEAVGGDSHLGGVDIDQRLFQHIAEKIRNQPTWDHVLRKPRFRTKLDEAIVVAKHALSVETETEICLDYGEEDLSLTLGRAQFEALNEDLFDRCMTIVQQALTDAGISKGAISDVILVGGSTRIPKVREMLKAFFGKEPLRLINADEAVAFGAAVQAGLLARSNKCTEAEASVSVRDVTALSIGLGVGLGVMNVIVPRNSPLPASKHKACYLIVTNDSLTCSFSFYEGERALCMHNRLVGQMSLKGLNPGSATDILIFDVKLRLDTHGIVHAEAELWGRVAAHSWCNLTAEETFHEARRHREAGRKVEGAFRLDMDVVHTSANGTKTTGHYTPEAKAEDARMWAAMASRMNLGDILTRWKYNFWFKNESTHILKHVNELLAWLVGQQELASKDEYQKKYQQLIGKYHFFLRSKFVAKLFIGDSVVNICSQETADLLKEYPYIFPSNRPI